MYRLLDNGLWTLVLLPFAALLVLLGVKYLAPGNRKGFALRITLAVNTCLLMLGGAFTGARADDEPRILCYRVAAPAECRPVEDALEHDAFKDLERVQTAIEEAIDSGEYSDEIHDALMSRAMEDIATLVGNNQITADEAVVLSAYFRERLEYYATAVGYVLCYEAVALQGKELTAAEIADRFEEMRKLYREGKLSEEVYEATLSEMEELIADYAADGDRAERLKAILIDLGDGEG